MVNDSANQYGLDCGIIFRTLYGSQYPDVIKAIADKSAAGALRFEVSEHTASDCIRTNLHECGLPLREIDHFLR